MKKRLIIFLSVLVLALSSLSASGELFLRPGFLVTYETNVFSDPLPIYKESNKEDGKGYLQRTGLGGYLDVDYFFSEDGKTALSFSFLYSHPVSSRTRIYGNSAFAEWVLTEDPSIFFSFGPMFRAQLGSVDFGVAIRASIGSINLFRDSVNLSLQVEPFVTVPLGSENWNLSAGMIYNAHFYDFLLGDTENIYRKDFFLLTLGGYIGIAYRWSV